MDCPRTSNSGNWSQFSKGCCLLHRSTCYPSSLWFDRFRSILRWLSKTFLHHMLSCQSIASKHNDHINHTLSRMICQLVHRILLVRKLSLLSITMPEYLLHMLLRLPHNTIGLSQRSLCPLLWVVPPRSMSWREELRGWGWSSARKAAPTFVTSSGGPGLLLWATWHWI